MSLARLVVHLESNHGAAVAGLNETVRSVNALQSQAQQLSPTVATTQKSMTDLQASARRMSSSLRAVSDGGSLSRIAENAVQLKDDFSALSSELQVTEFRLRQTAVGTSLTGSRFSLLGQMIAAVSTGAGAVASGLGAVGSVLTSILIAATAAIKVFGAAGYVARGGLIALSGAVTVLQGVLWTLLMPVRIFYRVLRFVAKSLWAVTAPVARLAVAMLSVWIEIKATIMALQWIKQVLSMVSWKVKLLIVALGALGVAARVCAPLVNALTWAVRAAMVPVRMLTIGWLVLKGQWQVAAAMAGRMLLGAVVRLSRSLLWLAAKARLAGMSLLKMGGQAAIAGMKALGGTVMSVTGRLTKMAGVAALLVAGFGSWGVQLAAQAESAQIPYENLLGTAARAKKMLREIESFAATTPFKNDDLKTSGRLLLTAGVPAGELIDHLRMFGDVAAGTQKPLMDYVDIFQRVISRQKASREELDGFARRGVPVYDALKQTMGLTTEELNRMIAEGKIGHRELRDAIALTTDETQAGIGVGGQFANATKNQSQVLLGLWSTLKDNIAFVARAFGEQIIGAVDLKSILTETITRLQSWRERVHELRPAIVAVYELFVSIFAAIKEILVVTADSFGLLGGDIIARFVEITAIVKWMFKQWPTIAEFVFTQLAFFVVRFTNQVIYLFKDVIPTVLGWGWTRFTDWFSTTLSGTKAFFSNMASNIVSIMKGVWDFIKSGGTRSLKFAWTPLLDGFKETVSELPDIPERAVGEIEQHLKSSAERLQEDMVGSLTKELTDAQNMVKRVRDETKDAKAAEEAELASVDFKKGNGPDVTTGGEDGVKQQVEVKVAGALKQGTAEAYSAIIQAMRERSESENVRLAREQLKVQTESAATQKEMNEKLSKKKDGQTLNSLS